MLKISDSTYFDSTPSEQTTPEERAGLNQPTEDELRRTNPKREDPRENQLTDNNEHGHDSPIGNRYDNNIPLESSLKLGWQAAKVLYERNMTKAEYLKTACCWIKMLRGSWYIISKKAGDSVGDMSEDLPTMEEARAKAREIAHRDNLAYVITKDEERYVRDNPSTESSLKLSWLMFHAGDTVRLNPDKKQYDKRLLGVDLRVDYVNETTATCTVYTAKPNAYGLFTQTRGVPFKDLILIKPHKRVSSLTLSWAEIREYKYQDIDMSQPEFKGKYAYYILGKGNKWHVAESIPGNLEAKRVSPDTSYNKAKAMALALAKEKQGTYIISAQEQVYLENMPNNAESSLKIGWLSIGDWSPGPGNQKIYTCWTFPSEKKGEYDWNTYEKPVGERFGRSVQHNVTYEQAVAWCTEKARENNGVYRLTIPDQQKRFTTDASLKLSWTKIMVGDIVKIVEGTDTNLFSWKFKNKEGEVTYYNNRLNVYDVKFDSDKGSWFPSELLKNIPENDLILIRKKDDGNVTESALKLSWQINITETTKMLERISGKTYAVFPTMDKRFWNVMLWKSKGGGYNEWVPVVTRLPYEEAVCEAKNYVSQVQGIYYISGSDETERSKNKISESSLEEVDWEIERTIEAFNSMRVSAAMQEPFTEKLKKRYDLANVPRETMVKSAATQLHPYDQRAAEEYGTTQVPISAAFIMSNGELIDSSGKMQGGYGEGRSIDHREIASAGIGDDDLPEEYQQNIGSSSNGLIYYMAMTGNIRISIDRGDTGITVDMQNPMNKAQWDTFVALAYGKEIYAYFCDKLGNKIDSGDFKNLRDFKKAYTKVYGKGARTSALHEYEENAKMEYGLTSEPNEVSFILSDGTMLSKKDAIEHSTIAVDSVYSDEVPEEGSSFYQDRALWHYMYATGGVRIAQSTNKNDLFVQTSRPMTDAQWSTLARLAKGQHIFGDFSDRLGNVVQPKNGRHEFQNLADYKYTADQVYGTGKTASYQGTLDSDQMLDFIFAKELKDSFGDIDYNTAKDIAYAADVWLLQEIPLQQFDWVAKPRQHDLAVPPIVLDNDGQFEVLDGKHRIGEAKARGESTILAYVGKSTMDAFTAQEFIDGLRIAYAASNEEINARVYEDRDDSQKSGPEMFWGSEEGQRTRFEFILSDGGKEKDLKDKFTGKTVLDVGCCVPGTHITLQDYAKKDIENVEVGDIVLTHNGNFEQVEKVMCREYSGELYTIKAVGLPNALPVTDEHPVYIMRNGKEQFVQVKDIQLTDLVGIPRVQQNNNTKCLTIINDKTVVLDNMLLYVIGLYLAEGYSTLQSHKPQNKYGVAFCFNITEMHLVDIVLKTIKDKFSVIGKVYKRPKKNTVEVRINSQDVGDFFRKYCGEYAKEKRIHADLLKLPNAQLLEVVKGFWEGDGHILEVVGKRAYKWKNMDKVTQHQHIHYQGGIVTVSEILRDQLWRILINNGYYVNKCEEISHGFAGSGPCFKLKTSDLSVLSMLDNSIKRKHKRGYAFSYITKKHIFCKIMSITKEQYSGKVYNLKVAKDNSYVANDIAVHNCGYADLFKYFLHHDIELKSYTGVDIVKKAINMCKRKYEAAFEVRDVNLNKDPYPDNSFDYVYGIGIFALNADNFEQYVSTMLKSMYNMCRVEAAANFALGSNIDKIFRTVYPIEVEAFANKITNNYTLEIDKENNEITIFLRK